MVRKRSVASADEPNLIRFSGRSVFNLLANYAVKTSWGGISVFARGDNVLSRFYFNTARVFRDRNADFALNAEDASIIVSPGGRWATGLTATFWKEKEQHMLKTFASGSMKIVKKHSGWLWVLMLLIGAMLSPASGLATGHGRHCDMHTGHGWHGGMHHHMMPGSSLHLVYMLIHRADALDLSKKQRDALGRILTDTETEMARQHAQTEILAARFHSALRKGKTNETDILAYAKKMGEFRGNELAIRLLATHKALTLLNNRQRALLWKPRHEGGQK